MRAGPDTRGQPMRDSRRPEEDRSVDVTALAFAQYVSELKSRASTAHNQLHTEMGSVRTAIGTNSADLQELKRHTAAVQQQMQGDISGLRESLSTVFMEITDGVRKGSEGDHDMKLNFQSLDEQLVQNETRLTQLSESAELSQVQMREFVSELQGQAERVKEELDGLKRFVEETEQRSTDRAHALTSAVTQLQKDRAGEVERRKDQVQKMRNKALQVNEQLAPIHADYQEHRADGTARQNRVQQGIFALEETRRAEERVDMELKQRIVSVSAALGQTAEHLRQVGEARRATGASPSGRFSSAPARRPSGDPSGAMYAQTHPQMMYGGAPLSPSPSASMGAPLRR